jgi:hypothetical protein
MLINWSPGDSFFQNPEFFLRPTSEENILKSVMRTHLGGKKKTQKTARSSAGKTGRADILPL